MSSISAAYSAFHPPVFQRLFCGTAYTEYFPGCWYFLWIRIQWGQKRNVLQQQPWSDVGCLQQWWFFQNDGRNNRRLSQYIQGKFWISQDSTWWHTWISEKYRFRSRCWKHYAYHESSPRQYHMRLRLQRNDSSGIFSWRRMFQCRGIISM